MSARYDQGDPEKNPEAPPRCDVLLCEYRRTETGTIRPGSPEDGAGGRRQYRVAQRGRSDRDSGIRRGDVHKQLCTSYVN